MGILRLILAAAVLLGHTGDLHGIRLIDEGFAVEAFFMLSGFYMALVLDQTYRGANAYGVFLENRVMRLYPMYAVVLVLTIPVAIVGTSNPAWEFVRLIDFPAFLLLAVSHLLIVGQELVYFFAVDPNGLYSSSEYAARQAASSNSVPLSGFLLVPQAWTLSFEMIFYAMAPFLVRRSTPIIAGLLALSLAIHAWIATADGVVLASWYYKFLPGVFWTFMAGILMYRAYRLVEDREYAMKQLIWAPVALIGIALSSAYLPYMDHWGFFIAIAILVPISFPLFSRSRDLSPALQRALRLDRYLGDLSYPVYISHILVLSAMYILIPRAKVPDLTLLDVVATLAFSALLLRLVGDPVERYRARNRARLGDQPDRAARRRERRAGSRGPDQPTAAR